ncbi:MAG TPA: signal recognition particle protein [Clostridiales bacterium]|nr:signal recognition particle protein [Clostridiales bacterium]
MALFGSLSEKLSHVFSKLTKHGVLTELEIKNAMREIRLALLEADVNYLVVKDLVSKISEKCSGERVLKSLTPGQQVIKIVNEELTALMGSTNSKLTIASKPPTIILMCGLQGAGKTTMCGKLAKMLKKQGKKPLLVACDIYRPAAINQLKVVGKSVDVEVYEEGTQKPSKTATNALKYAESKGYDVVIVDTAGRLHISTELMDELKEIKKAINPTEILLTVDSMTGQDAVTVAEGFNNDLDITGVILTKLDGDTRGGAALSIKAVTGKPIKFCGIGEKMDDIEPFYPDRMASRILDMGDVLTLIEKAQTTVNEEEAKKLEKKFRENSFTFEDYLVQFDQVRKMGNIADIINMIPGASKFKLNANMLDEKQIARNKAIIQSMTPYERRNPDVIKGSQKKRIAMGSGTSIQEVNALLKNFYQSKELMKQMSNNKGRFRMPF